MRLASKINTALIAAFAGGTLATFAVLQSAIQPRFDEIERASAQMNHKRVTDAFDAMSEKLQTAAQDYAFWDESYKFLQGEGVDTFIASNLNPEFKAVENLGVNALIFLRGNGTVAWGAAYDLDNKERLEGGVDEIAHFSRSHPYIGISSRSSKRGIIKTSKGLMLVAITPVLKSDGTGDPVGKVIAAKFLDVEAAKSLTGVHFELAELPAVTNYSNLIIGTSITTLADHVETTTVLRNVIGQPLAIVKASSPRDVSHTGALAIASALKMMVLAGFLALLILWAFMHQVVAKRIEALARHFKTAGAGGKIRSATDAGDDEIGDLAKSFNGMAEEVNVLRDSLADSSFMAGLSEWAAGTLHNVRNGLSPIGANSWQIDQLFEKSWLGNLETAIAQHADASTDPERRAKLNAYLVASAGKFLSSAQKASELTRKIKDASEAIVDMTTEFERYAHRNTVSESIELRPLVQSVAATCIEASRRKVDLIMPKFNVEVLANGVILRQILGNVIINALEAMPEGPHGKIAISMSNQVGSEFVELKISDNGKGISPSQLKHIFERGHSTKIDRPGGLGLHWCANAVNVLGGTIHAESPGIGLGTSIIITLPSPSKTRRAA